MTTSSWPFNISHFHQCANWTLTLSQKHRRPCNRTYPMQSCLGGHNHVMQNTVSIHCWLDTLPHTTQPICTPPSPSPGHLLQELSFCWILFVKNSTWFLKFEEYRTSWVWFCCFFFNKVFSIFKQRPFFLLFKENRNICTIFREQAISLYSVYTHAQTEYPDEKQVKTALLLYILSIIS